MGRGESQREAPGRSFAADPVIRRVPSGLGAGEAFPFLEGDESKGWKHKMTKSHHQSLMELPAKSASAYFEDCKNRNNKTHARLGKDT